LSARSYLYVPGTRPDRFDKAAQSGADAIILDLEDAVPPSAKAEARTIVAAWLKDRVGDAPEIWVRLNGGALLEDDASALVEVGVQRLSLPKASLDELVRLDIFLEGTAVAVSALVETAAGILDARIIAEGPRVTRLAIGEADLSSELGIDASEDARELAPMRAQVVLASAAAAIEPPIGSVSTDFQDLDAFRTSTEALKRMGFGARAAIHPAQVTVINEVFTPSDVEIEAARKLLAAFDAAGGGVTLDENGRMVDEAVVRAARRTLGTKHK